MNRIFRAVIFGFVLLAWTIPCFGDYAIHSGPTSYHVSMKKEGGSYVGTGAPLSIGVTVINDSYYGPSIFVGAYFEMGYASPIWLTTGVVGGPGNSGSWEVPASAFRCGSANIGPGPYKMFVQAHSGYAGNAFLIFWPIKLVEVTVDFLPAEPPPPIFHVNGETGGRKGRGCDPYDQPKPPSCTNVGENILSEDKPGEMSPPSVNDPVNLVSGNFLFSEEDGSLKSRSSMYLLTVRVS